MIRSDGLGDEGERPSRGRDEREAEGSPEHFKHDTTETPAPADEDVVDMLMSRYCPKCDTHYPLQELVCCQDGTGLRDLSFSTLASYLMATGDPSETSAFVVQNGSVSSEGAPPDAGTPFGPARLLGGKWRMIEQVGKGGFGKFWLGQHEILGMRVGIKILKRRFTASGFGRRLFHEEAMRLSRLDHPNIVKVLDYGEEDDQPYLVMEYLSGRPLHRYMEAGSLSLEEGIEVVRQVALALVAAHEGAGMDEPLVHLDLKPEHIFLEEFPDRRHVKVIDFGIAEIAAPPGPSGEDSGSAESQKRVAGTFPYMAPERWDGVVDPRCDLYSLGVILYELVARRKPFMGRTSGEFRDLHRTFTPPRPSQARLGRVTPALKELDSIILSCLEKRPEDRPQTAQALADTLEDWLVRPRLSRGQRLLRAVLVPTAVTILLLAATLGVLYWLFPGKVTFVMPDEAVVINDVALMRRGGEWQVPVAMQGFISLPRGEAFLALEKEKGAESCEVPLEWQPDGKCRVAGEDIEKTLPLESWSGVWEASFLVSVPPGRKIASEPFHLQLDGDPPEIAKENGIRGDCTENQPGSIVGYGEGLIVVEATEELDIASCRLTWESADQKEHPVTASEGTGNVVKFELPPDGRKASKLGFHLVDLAGNGSENYSYSFSWDETPEVAFRGAVHEGTIYTNKARYELVFEVRNAYGDVKVFLEGQSIQARPASGSVRSVEITFRENELEPQRKLVKISLSSRAGRKTEPEPQVAVEYLRRDGLKMRANGGDRLSSLKGLALLHRDRQIKEQGIECWSFLREPPAKDHPLELKPDAEEGTWTFESIQPIRGKVKLFAQATDRYGNRSELLELPFGEEVSPPEVKVLSVGGGISRGEGRYVLLNSEEETLQLSGASEMDKDALVIEAKFVYPEELVWELRVNDDPIPLRGQELKELKAGDENRVRVTLPLSWIHDRLRQGPDNFISITARDADPKFERLLGSDKIPLYYCDVFAHELQVKVGDKVVGPGEVTSDKIDMELGWSGGPKVSQLKVAAGGKLVDGVRETEKWKAGGLPIAAAGPTQIDVSFEFEGGFRIPVQSRTYWRQPEKCISYSFLVKGVEVLFYPIVDGQGRTSFWCSSLSDCAKLAKLAEATTATDAGAVQIDAATEIARHMGALLCDAGLVASPDAVRLPSQRDVQSIREACPDALGTEKEWVQKEGPDAGQGIFLPAVFAVKGNATVALKGSDGRCDTCCFRLILETDREKLHPGKAMPAR